MAETTDDSTESNPYDEPSLRMAWDGGYRSRCAGRRRTECPYHPSNGDTRLANAWIGGWIAANLELRFDVHG
jgi:ribosome modulation factor